MGKFGYIENNECCTILDTLQWESIQDGVKVVQAGDDEHLDQILQML